MNLGKRFEKAFEMAGLRAPQVARASGVPAATINAMMRRDSRSTGFTEELLAVLPAHRVNIDWVRTGQGTPEPIANQRGATAPVKEGGAGAVRPADVPAATEGVGLSVTLQSWDHPKELPPGDWVFLPKLGVLYGSPGTTTTGTRTVLLKDEVQPFRTHWIRQGGHAPRGLAWHEAPDASMHPTICVGDNIVVDTQQQRPLIDGRTYAFWYGDALRPRRVQLLPNGGARLVPKNAEFPTVDLSAAELAEINILGRVVHREGSGEL